MAAPREMRASGETRGRRLGAAAALAGLLLGTVPQSALASSRFSQRGEGESLLSQSAEARGMGGAEAATTTPSLTGNPASLAFTNQSRFFGSWETEWIRAEETLDGGNPVAKDYSGYVPNLGLVFSLRPDLAIGVGLLVERRTDARIELARSVTGGPNYTQIFEANGNHLRIPVLISWNHPRAQVGTGLDLQLVNSRLRWRNQFETGADFANSDDLEKRQLFGVGWRVGARVPVGSRAAIGGWAALPGTLNGNLRFENDDNDDSDDLKLDADLELPARVSLGFEVHPLPQLQLVGDWTHEAWEDVTPADAGDAYVNVNRIAVGAEWGDLNRGKRGWPLRVGYRTEPLHVLDQHEAGRSEKIIEHAVSAGTGLRFAGGRGVLDTYLEYGWRGVQDESEYSENFVRFGVTLTGLEAWTRRRPPEAEEDW